MKTYFPRQCFHIATFLNLVVFIVAAVNGKTPSCNVPNSELGRALDVSQDTNDKVSSRLAYSVKGELWEEGNVHYLLDQDKLTENQITLIYQAFSEYHKKTCVRFKPMTTNVTRRHPQNYINITTTSGKEICSLSDVCMKGGQQFVQLGEGCWFQEMIIHQLGHTLCLGHEHQRPVRDSFLKFRYTCDDKEIPTMLDDNEAHHGFYDYASQMHFACGWCGGGWPKNKNVSGCGYQVTEGLSLLDADYINMLYDCGGCHRHRWVPVDKLVPQHKKHMYNFGYRDRLGHPLYPCRVSYGGEIVIGKFTWSKKICSFSLGGKEHYESGSDAEVLLIPGGLRDGSSEYKLEQISAYSEDKLLKIAVPAGRLTEKDYYASSFVAYGRAISPFDWEYEDTIGKALVKNGRISNGFFPLGGKEVSKNFMKVLTCHD